MLLQVNLIILPQEPQAETQLERPCREKNRCLKSPGLYTGSRGLQRPSSSQWAPVSNSLGETHLGGHDQLVINNVVGGVAHSKEGAGGV